MSPKKENEVNFKDFCAKKQLRNNQKISLTCENLNWYPKVQPTYEENQSSCFQALMEERKRKNKEFSDFLQNFSLKRSRKKTTKKLLTHQIIVNQWVAVFNHVFGRLANGDISEKHQLFNFFRKTLRSNSTKKIKKISN